MAEEYEHAEEEHAVESEQLDDPSAASADHPSRFGAFLLLFCAAVMLFYSARNATARRLADHAQRAQFEQPAIANEMAQSALEAWPTYSDALVAAAQLQYRNDNIEEARQYLEKAVAVANAPGVPMQLLASILVKDPDTSREGLALFERGMRLSPPRGEKAKSAWANFAEAAIRSGNNGLGIWAYFHAQEEGFAGGSMKKMLPQAYQALQLPIAAQANSF